MAPRPHDGSEPEETWPESDDPGRPDQPGEAGRAALPDGEIEARWVEIVTHLDESADETSPPGDDQARPADGASAAADAGAADSPGSEPAMLSASDPRGWSPEDVEEHFEPPDPGPVFGGDPLLTMAWIAVVVPPILLVISVLAWRDMPSVALRIAGVAFLIGIGVLLWRMPASRDEEDGPGAVV